MITERIDNIIRIPEERLCVKPPIPKSVKIELTGRCNFRCRFCSLSARKDKASDIDWELFKRVTLELKESGVEEIGIFLLGESFTAPKLLIRAIDWLKMIDTPYVFLTSNASLARADVVVDCMKAGLDSIKWSVNFADEEQFRNITRAPGILFHKAINNIMATKVLRDAGNYKTKLYASSILYDESQKEKMSELLEEFIIPCVDQHYWLPLYRMGSASRDAGLNPISGNTGRLDNPVAPVPCWSLFTEGHIMSDGWVTACGFDSTGEWAMGDLKEESFMDIWHNEEFQQLRRAHINGDVTNTKCGICNG